MIRALTVTIALLALPAPALAVDPAIKDGSAQRALDAARDRWERRGLDDYSYRVRATCFCPQEYTRGYTVEVRDGRPQTRHRYVRGWNTVPKVFRVVQRAIKDRADDLDVRYGRRGAPEAVYVDRSVMIADEELALRVRKLRRLR